MILAIDIGNTDLKAAVFPEGGGPDAEPLRHLRLGRSAEESRDAYASSLGEFLREAGLEPGAVKASVVSSVRASSVDPVVLALTDVLGRRPLVVGRELIPKMPSALDYPVGTGVDRILNVIAAWEIRRGPMIVVDTGTAITFDLIRGGGEYAGGVIAPGVGISAGALNRMTSALPVVEPARPEALVSKKTAEAIRSGLFWGFVSLVDGIVERMIRESGEGPGCLGTGGFAGLISQGSRFVTEVDPYLTLKGIRIAYERSRHDD